MEDVNETRRGVSILLFIAGCATAGLAFWQANVAQSSDRLAVWLGGRGGDRTVMWVLIGATAVLLFAGLITWLSTNSSSTTGTTAVATLVPSWYDDPEDPEKLRYWDGTLWTEKIADKG